MAKQRDPIREWREQYARCCLDVDFEPSSSATFYASVKPIYPELHITRAALSPGFLFRDDDLIRDGNDSFELIVAQSGELNVTQQGRDIRLGPGDATIMRASTTGRVGSHEGFGFVEVLIPPAEWDARGAQPEDGLMRCFLKRSDAMQLLRRYIHCLERNGLAVFGNDPTIVRRHVIDLMVLAATPHQCVDESNLSTVVVAHTRAIFDHLTSHFSDPELSLPKVAQNMRISRRYLQRLLKKSGTSFTAHVTELRLNHAFALLTTQGKGDVPVCDVALQVGFSDISHFNRLFRSRFGDTPKGVRAHARIGSTQDRIL